VLVKLYSQRRGDVVKSAAGSRSARPPSEAREVGTRSSRTCVRSAGGGADAGLARTCTLLCLAFAIPPERARPGVRAMRTALLDRRAFLLIHGKGDSRYGRPTGAEQRRLSRSRVRALRTRFLQRDWVVPGQRPTELKLVSAVCARREGGWRRRSSGLTQGQCWCKEGLGLRNRGEHMLAPWHWSWAAIK